MPWNPFLMKKLLKSEVYGSRKQCTGALFTGEQSTTATKNKNKKREKTRKKKTHRESKHSQ